MCDKQIPSKVFLKLSKHVLCQMMLLVQRKYAKILPQLPLKLKAIRVLEITS